MASLMYSVEYRCAWACRGATYKSCSCGVVTQSSISDLERDIVFDIWRPDMMIVSRTYSLSKNSLICMWLSRVYGAPFTRNRKGSKSARRTSRNLLTRSGERDIFTMSGIEKERPLEDEGLPKERGRAPPSAPHGWSGADEPEWP